MLTLEMLREDFHMVNPVRVIHTICGAIIFFTDGSPKQKQGILNPQKVVLINGVHPKDGDPIYCQGCGYEVRKDQMQWVLNDD